ncbi:hypothetical protein FQU23_005590 [Flavobacterium sp. XN-5]|uniref:hypothetical protein n=1 Tax=Flavobacterium sp. XN-5 TaxID=2599390 RepID=UPI0011C8E6E3|nr:hypothetical protein [Flavobacterium sp. XN-5]NGY36983.1 hypothetical protein [Flavobacterium sp. XN-5]
MNDAHLHLMVNHFPIIGTIFGIGILIAGLVLKNNALKNTAYILFIVAALFAALSMNTGEGAEELVEDMPNIGKKIIHEHEELAEKLALLLYATGIFSLLSIYTSSKNHKLAIIASYITLFLAIGAAVLGSSVGTSGGEIRHTEIRDNAGISAAESDNINSEITRTRNEE